MTNYPMLTITYFGTSGRVEPMRLAAAIGKVPYAHKAVDFKDWKDSVKSEITLKNPLGQLPILEVDQGDGEEPQVIAESDAMLKYFGKLAGLSPANPVDACKVDAYICTMEEIFRPIAMTFMGGERFLLTDADKPWSEDDIAAIRKRMAENEQFGFPFYLRYFESILEKNGTSSGWLAGDAVTIADLKMHTVLSILKGGMIPGMPADIVDKYPLLSALHSKVEAIPAVADFRSKYQQPYTDYEFEV